MNKNIDNIIKNKIIAIITALMPEAKIYLFGSRARNTQSQWSDIDLALDAGKELNFRDLGEVKSLMEALNIPYKVDIVDFHRVSDSLKNEIMKDKIVWKA